MHHEGRRRNVRKPWASEIEYEERSAVRLASLVIYFTIFLFVSRYIMEGTKKIESFIRLCDEFCKQNKGLTRNKYAIYLHSLLDDFSISALPEYIRDEIEGYAKEFFDKFPNIQLERIKHNDILGNAIAEKSKQIFDFLTPYFSFRYFENERKNMNSINNSINIYKQAIQSESDKYEKFCEEKKKEITEFIEKIYTERGLGEFGKKYEEEADSMKKVKEKWLWATIGFTVAALLLALIFYFSKPDIQPLAFLDFLYLFTMKFFMLGILVFAISWCAKMYSLTQQQELINKNKALITKTYNSFIEGTEDKETRNAILSAASSELFSLSNTGFVPGKESNLDVLEQTAKIVTALTQKAK